MGHLEKTAHKSRTAAVEKCRRFGSVAIFRFVAVTVTFEKTQGNECVEEIRCRAGMKSERIPQLNARFSSAPQFGKNTQLNRRQQSSRRPKCHADFHDPSGRQGARVCSCHNLKIPPG